MVIFLQLFVLENKTMKNCYTRLTKTIENKAVTVQITQKPKFTKHMPESFQPLRASQTYQNFKMWGKFIWKIQFCLFRKVCNFVKSKMINCYKLPKNESKFENFIYFFIYSIVELAQIQEAPGLSE